MDITPVTKPSIAGQAIRTNHNIKKSSYERSFGRIPYYSGTFDG